MDLIQRQHGDPSKGVCGIWCFDQLTKEVITLSADAVIIATGELASYGQKPLIQMSLLEMELLWHFVVEHR